MGYATVVVGTDGSSPAEEAVRTAAELAAAGGMRLVVVSAYGTAPQGDPGASPVVPPDRARAEEVSERGRVLAEELGVADPEALTVEGPSADVLLEAALGARADLLVLGARGVTKPQRALLGATANRVSHHATCDVLIVHRR
jgi:nucleotide-binding universal stress UspA family protein